MASYFRTQLESWIKTIDVKADRVLDVGGGANPVKGRTKSWAVDYYRILDNNLEGDFKIDVLLDLNLELEGQKHTVFNYNPGSKIFTHLGVYDIIFCLEVMEYVWNPKTAIEHLYSLINEEGGTLYISFPFLYPHHNPAGHDYLRYTRWGVEKLLTETGFEIEYITPRIEMGDLRISNWFLSEKMHPCKGMRHDEIGFMVKAIKK